MSSRFRRFRPSLRPQRATRCYRGPEAVADSVTEADVRGSGRGIRAETDYIAVTLWVLELARCLF